MTGLYLLHFAPPYKHARHYLGYAVDIDRRVREHLACGGRSSPLVRAAIGVGSTVTVARIFAGADRRRERSIKRAGGLGRSCPICRAGGYARR